MQHFIIEIPLFSSYLYQTRLTIHIVQF